MKKILCILFISMGFVYAQESAAKVVYDLTTKDVANFERRILSATVKNKSYYEGKFRDLDVVLVVHGGAYRFFVKDPAQSEYKEDKALMSKYQELAKRIKTLATTYEVEILICGAGMSKHTLEKKDMFDFVDIIPNATIGLIDKQNEGYAYVPVGD